MQKLTFLVTSPVPRRLSQDHLGRTLELRTVRGWPSFSPFRGWFLMASLALGLGGCFNPGGGWTLRSGFDCRTHKKPGVFMELVDTRWDEWNRIAQMNAMGGFAVAPAAPVSACPPPEGPTLPPAWPASSRTESGSSQAPLETPASQVPLPPDEANSRPELNAHDGSETTATGSRSVVPVNHSNAPARSAAKPQSAPAASTQKIVPRHDTSAKAATAERDPTDGMSAPEGDARAPRMSRARQPNANPPVSPPLTPRTSASSSGRPGVAVGKSGKRPAGAWLFSRPYGSR